MERKKRRSRCHLYEKRFVDLNELCRFYHEQTGKQIPAETIEHERAHYNKARELGYETEFKLRFGRNCFTMITLEFKGEREVSDEDLIAIAEAPENPSFEDYMTAKSKREKYIDRVNSIRTF